MKWLAALAALFALPACAEEHTLNISPVIQLHDNLCWAAVSAMASSASRVPCQYRKPTQLHVVFSENVQTHELPIRCPVKRNCAAASAAEIQCKPDEDGIPMPDPDILASGRATCGPDGANCDVPRDTWLLDLQSRTVASLGPANASELTAERIGHEIETRKQPVIISWNYLDSENSPREAGRHFLIITGYNDVTQEVRVWDPWPALGIDEPEGHIRHKWIPYEKYQNPVNDNGAPVEANHDADEFAFCRGCSPAELASTPPGPAPLQHILAQRIASPTLFNFAHGVPELIDERKRAMSRRVVRREDGARISGPLRTDAGFATVAISTRRLLRERPEALLEPETTSLVVPVLRNKQLVDSFLLINSGGAWQEGGYSNNEIARRLMQYRTERGSEGRFYLLAIPEQGKFYLARGFGAQAELVPLDGNIHGQFVAASDVLTRLVEEIRHRRGSQPGRPEGPSG